MGLIYGFMKFFFVIFLFSCATEAQIPTKFFNVLNYGAKPDGKTDNSKAFLKAWNEACEWEGKARVLIPKGTYKLNKVKFYGPCEGPIAFIIKGVLKATTDPSKIFAESWINFRYIDHLTVGGGGTLDGQGAVAWPLNDCGENPKCKSLPTSMRFDFVTNSRVHHLKSIDSKNNHFNAFGCSKLNFTKIRISAPGDSPNTDGIKIGSSNRIKIKHSVIGTGDDCVSVLSGSRKIHISKVVCGPGHGISVGSLGKYEDEDDVMGVIVKNCTFRDTTDGVRIKSWASPLSLQAFDFTYENIYMENVENPIIIDQEYCPHGPCKQEKPSHVQISNVTYRNIWGSSKSKVAVNFKCSKSKPCKNIVLDNINLSSSSEINGRLISSCSYVNGVSIGHQSPPACI